MYDRPPLIANGASPALIVGTVAADIIAAPGAGLALRIVGVSFWLNRVVGVATIVDTTLGDSGGGNMIARGNGLSIQGLPGSYQLFPEPGIQITVNTAFEIRAASTAVGGVVNVTVYYYIDKVT